MANEDKSARYHRLARRASMAQRAMGMAVLLMLLLSGTSVWLRSAIAFMTGGSVALTTAVFVLVVALMTEMAQLPLSFYRSLTLEQAYGLSTQTRAQWWRDQGKGLVVTLPLLIGGAWMVVILVHRMPDYWWAAAALMCTAMLVLLAHLTPVVLLPLFYDVRPLDRPTLVERLMRLADRAGARVMGVFEWRLSDRTTKANAALTGLGRTRRILLSDTLLSAHSDDEIEVILAHELAHHVHRDIWSAIAVEGILIAIGCYLANASMDRFAVGLGLAGKSDVAALPLLALVAAVVSVALMPIVHAFSRAHERRADRFALDLTGNASAFVTAMTRLGAQNLAEERPSRLVEVLFHSHPPMAARIAAARQWERTRVSEAPVTMSS